MTISHIIMLVLTSLNVGALAFRWLAPLRRPLHDFGGGLVLPEPTDAGWYAQGHWIDHGPVRLHFSTTQAEVMWVTVNGQEIVAGPNARERRYCRAVRAFVQARAIREHQDAEVQKLLAPPPDPEPPKLADECKPAWAAELQRRQQNIADQQATLNRTLRALRDE